MPLNAQISALVRGDQFVNVSVSADDNGDSVAMTFRVISSPDNVTASGHGPVIRVSNLRNGQAYRFAVNASNSVGTSLRSAFTNATATPGECCAVHAAALTLCAQLACLLSLRLAPPRAAMAKHL